jgi:hypothetical protein
MAEDVVDGDAIEEPAGTGAEHDAEVRQLPARRGGGEIDTWRGEVRSVALAAAGGLAAGAATVVAVHAVRGKSAAKPSRKIISRGRKQQQNVVASRSFLVDVHVLGR